MDSQQAYQQCLQRLTWACDRLQANIDPAHLSQIADLIVQPMTGLWRFFHTPQHIFDVGGDDDPIEVLAALFHDLVYVQVDRCINFNISYYITPFSQEVKGQLVIRPKLELPADATFEMVALVFGFVPEQVLNPFAGQNEFLSALVAAKALEPFLKMEQLTQIVACIEATIPFRGKTEAGLTASDVLYESLLVARRQFNLSLTNEEIEETVKKGVRVCNRDVGSFAHPSAAHFLANTWNLLPETNHNLIDCIYTVRDYRVALQKMEGFISCLTPGVIFRQFKAEPEPRIYQLLESGVEKNLAIAKLYLGSKLVAIALVEALSRGIGLNVPLATMMGKVPEQNYQGDRLEIFIPNIANAYQPKTEIEREVLRLLEEGRAPSIYYDLETSPLATFLVKLMGFDAIRSQWHRAKQFFNDNISAHEFIAGFDPAITNIVIEAVFKLFDGRKSAISSYIGISLLQDNS